METEIPPEAQRLHAEGRAAGGQGDYDQALALLEQAATLAPQWPYPPYDAAFTLLMRGDTQSAQAMYERVDALAPSGFFTCKTTLDMLRREHAGQLFPGFSRAFIQLEWMTDPAEKIQLLRGITKRFPDFPPAWQELASLLTDPAEKMAALDNGLAGSPDPETKTMLLINKAGIHASAGDMAAATRIYTTIVEDPHVTASGIAFAELFFNNRASSPEG
ncbi:MAG: tetratricopeptide repeat protein [Catenulisporales bacterium]|jgi:tetratricopeptide (TPR) repeat protein|nr:tetratricopeptide repeat protein [Catenulisporales bacterium]